MTGEAGIPRAFVRDVGLIARFELAEALRSKLLIVMMLLFVGAGAMGAWIFSAAIASIEENAAKVTGAPEARRPGGTMKRMRDSGSYREALELFIRDDAKADYFAALPPIVVFFGWAMFLFTPFLVLFTSAETIASDVANRSIRYSVLRSGRLQFALGKALGQLVIVVGVTTLSSLIFYWIAWALLGHFEHATTALGMLSYLPRILLYALPFLGWALFASMVTRSANLARILSMGGGIGLGIISILVANPPRWLRGGAITDAVRDLFGFLTPFGHHDGLFYPRGGALLTDIVVCLALAALYFASGYLLFLRRRDL